ncbi:Cation/calcium exchanger 1 [Platanthera zijinensis]|uniref:Cation/calcium exchanger 1 n=1 Tax=Platanthera zijinensis TaxID=2320716 RepID=A0AAP0AYH5_9ASPA
MALAFFYKSHRMFINISFIILLCFFLCFFSLSSSATQRPAFLLSSSRRTDSEYACRALNDSKSKCLYLKNNHQCGADGYIDYLGLFYCVFGFSPVLGYISLAIWLLILFYLLGNTASHYFCPSLESLSRVLKLSPTIAGVTLLSLGNGAPDVFAAIVSFDSGGASTAAVGLSSVLGGAFFVSTVVVGVISICCSSRRPPVSVDRTTSIRDICFFLVVLFVLILLLSVGKVHIFGSMLFVSLYILYVVVVSITHCCRKKLPELGAPLLVSIEAEQPKEEAQGIKQSIKPPPLMDWIVFFIELPLFLPRRLTIPVVTKEKWSKPFAVASVVLSPILLAVLWNTQKENPDSEDSITVLLSSVLLGMILGITASESTESSQPPKLLLPWLAAGFTMSVVWTYIVAGELVSLLVSVGHIVGISPSILGVTVLAWGNSVGDLIANVAMAVNGGDDGAQIAIAGCYAGPIFNTLVGLGISLVLSSWSAYPSSFVIPVANSQFVVIGFLVGGLLWALAILSRTGMKLSWALGVGLLAIYSCFLCLRLLQSLELL